MSEKTSAQHIVWCRDGQPLERHSSQLSIPSIVSSDAGLYRCYVSNAFGGAFSLAVNVSVNYFHGFGDEPDAFFDRRVVLNSPINLRPPSLKIGGYMSNLHWAWFKDGQKLNSDDRRYFLSYSGELVVLRADDLAMGIYRVEVHRDLTPVFHARDYLVVAEPSSLPIEPSFDIIYRPRDVKVVIMNTNKGNPPTMAIFECVPTLRNALETEIRWLLNSEQLSDSTGHVRFELGGQRLRILDVAQLLVGLAAHSVAIQCKVRIRTMDGANWMDQADARLDILAHVVEKRVGDPLQLECHAERAWPRANFSWYFNDQKLVNAGAERLVISNLSVNHFGAYQCEATNTAGTDIVPIWVVRHEDANHSPRKTPTFSTDRPTPSEDSQSPIIIQGPQNQSLLIGSKVQLPCQIAPGNDGLRAFWFINNEQIPSAGGDPFHRVFVDANGTMWINQVGQDNTGEYRCTARTIVGGGGVERARQTAWLSIIEKPGMVQNVRAELTNSTGQERILVHWTPGFDGNSPVVKWSVEMRTKPTGQLTVFWSDWELAIELFSPTKLVASSDCCATFVENVRPAATAEFRVIAHNKFGVGKPSVPSQNVKMPQRPPTAVPTKVHASARSSQSVMVQWQPPEHGETNEESDIRGYLVRYRLSGYSTADWNDRNVSDGLARNVLIEPLITWREYDVQVAAYNDRGLGVFSRPVTVTTLEGLPLQAPQNVHVKVINSTAILLAFDPPNQQMILGVNLGYRIELWEGPPALFNQPSYVERLVPAFSRIEHRIERLKKFARYNLTVLCFTAPGDGPRSDPVEFQTAEDLPGPVRSLEPLDVFSESALVQWEAPVEPNGIIQKYLLAWTENGSNKRRDVEISGHQHNYSIEGLLAQTKYTVELTNVRAELTNSTGQERILVHWTPGFDGNSPVVKCYLVRYRLSGYSTADWNDRNWREYDVQVAAYNDRGLGVFSRPVTVTTLEGLPLQAPQNVHVKVINSTAILLAFDPPNQQMILGVNLGYRIELWEETAGPSTFVCGQAFTKIGAGLMVETRFESGVPPELPSPPTGLSVAEIMATKARIHFVPGSDRHAPILSPNQTEVERAFEKLKMTQFVIPGGAKIHQYHEKRAACERLGMC
uniref:Ig-like domain-containing protein n=1 Tax=Globodera pallida TaxID=36090 RepID=A0A183C9U8_GLOPA